MAHVPGCLTDGCRCNCAHDTGTISTCSKSQDVETSFTRPQFVGNVVVDDTNTCGPRIQAEASLWPDSVNELWLRNRQVAVGVGDLTVNEQFSSVHTPATCVGRSQGSVSSADENVSEEPNGRGSMKAPLSVYIEMKDATGWRGNDSELCGASDERKVTVDSWMKTNSDVVATGAPNPENSVKLCRSQESPKPGDGMCVALHTEDYAGKLKDKNQACVEISSYNLVEQWWTPQVGEDRIKIAENEMCLSQELPESRSAGFVLASGDVAVASAIPGMADTSLWEMVVKCDDHRKVTVCIIDEIFRIPEYLDAGQTSQPLKVNNTLHTAVTKHTKFLEGEDYGATKLSGYSSKPPGLYSIFPNREENSEIPDPCWWEGATPKDLSLGDEQQSDKHLLSDSHKMKNKCFGIDSSLILDKESFESTSFGGLAQELTFNSEQNEPVCEIRELSQELSSMIILTSDRLLLSKESHIAYFTLDLDFMSDSTASLCVLDVNCQMSLEKTDDVNETEDKKRPGIPLCKSDTYLDCELVLGQQPGADFDNCVMEIWEAETRTTKQGNNASCELPLVSSLLTTNTGKEKQSLTVTKTAAVGHNVTKSCKEDKIKCSSSHEKNVHPGMAKENLLKFWHNKERLQSEISSRQNKLLNGFPVRNKGDKVSGAVVSKKPYSDVGEDQLCTKKAPRMLQDIWAERDRSESMGLRLQFLLGQITEDCTIVWSKDGAVLAEEKRSTGDVRQISLGIAKASKLDLGTYQCLLSSPHGQTCSEYHLTAEVLKELIPELQQNEEEIKEIKEDVKCAQLLFKEDFLREQYFSEHKAASIITEGVHFGEGMHRRAFRTRLVGGTVTDFRPGQPCVLKVHNSVSYGTRNNEELICRNYNLAAEECYIQNIAREYIKAYRDIAKAAETFGEVPEIIPIYLVHRPSNDIPYATLEEELIGDFVKYSVRDGREVSLTRRESEAGQKCCAFQHWVYHKTEGNLLVTDMQGVGMKLTDVGIATCRKGYRGFRGNCATSFIDQFRALHQCNRFCLLLGLRSLRAEQPKPMRTANDPKPKKTFTSLVNKKP